MSGFCIDRKLDSVSDPIERGLRLFGVFGKIDCIYLDGASVPKCRINLMLGEIVKGLITINALSIARIGGMCILRINTESSGGGDELD